MCGGPFDAGGNPSDRVSVAAEPYESIAQAVAPEVQLVLETNTTESSFYVSDLPTGTYIVILRTTAGTSVQRLVVE
ncbi:MAG: T9SS type A sorting domain-containing protein [Bacteroidales bacterium]|nr:T9SS type A sorting domain-containing protein [Bacteroidales bacterium]